MRLIVLMTVCFFAACAQTAPPENAAPKNKQTSTEREKIATLNEVTLITKAMQTLEKQGRDLENLRQSADAESRRQCGIAMEDRQRQTGELDERVKKLASPFNAQLSPIIADLNVCVSCAKGAMESCVKTRAAVNQAIKDIYRQ